jgi:SAM-dependent methyltransferase
MKILNLGCGTKTSDKKEVINIDWSIYLRIKKMRHISLLAPFIFRGDRLKQYRLLPDNIMVHNLATGIPFASNSIDAVYHSHVLEHLDSDIADAFLIEVKRVLKPGGIHRIVVPDFEKYCAEYLQHVISCEKDSNELAYHDSYIARILEQSVRKESHGTSKQKPLRRFLENLILGDARHRGETHQWMYDRFSLEANLLRCGYSTACLLAFDKSGIPNWNSYGLDVDEECNQYKPESLYLEAIK